MNPFVFGEIVDKNHFCNRKSEINFLIKEIESGQNITIFSPRRFGKTSLISITLDHLNKKDFISFYIDLFPMLNEKNFASICLNSFSKIFSKDIKTRFKNIKTFFKNIDPSISFNIGDSGTPSLNIDFNKKDTSPVISDIFEGIYEILKKKKKRGVIVFDEFQQISILENPGIIENTLRTIIQKHRNVSYIFMGSQKHLLLDIFNNKNRPFYNSSLKYPIEKIEKNVFAKFIKKKFNETGRIINFGTAENIVETSEKHPFYTQMLAHYIWNDSRKNSVIEISHINNSVELILKSNNHAFFNTWDTLKNNQKKVIIALSHLDKNEKILSNDIIKKYDLKSKSSIQRSLEQLEKADIIDKQNGNFQINDVFLKIWVKAKFSI